MYLQGSAARPAVKPWTWMTLNRSFLWSMMIIIICSSMSLTLLRSVPPRNEYDERRTRMPSNVSSCLEPEIPLVTR